MPRNGLRNRETGRSIGASWGLLGCPGGSIQWTREVRRVGEEWVVGACLRMGNPGRGRKGVL